MAPSSPSTILTYEESRTLLPPDRIFPFVLGHRLYLAIQKVDQYVPGNSRCPQGWLIKKLMSDRQIILNTIGGRSSAQQSSV